MNVGAQLPAIVVGRYALFDEIASGGMATVHYGRLLGPSGFSRTVAIKRLHPHLAHDAEFSTMFLDEARVAARVRHPNVVPTLDIVNDGGELFLVMEYVQGESLSRLARATKALGEPVPPSIAAAIMVGVLHGLHAAHEAVDERGQPLGIVHRDVSPQNILIGLDGIPRLVDFGVAKAAGRIQTTREGQLKGKIAYMAPEQIRGAEPTRVVDVYAASIVLWEMLANDRLFGGENDVTSLERALNLVAEAPSRRAAGISPELDEVVLRGLSRDPEKRFRSAREMARAIENVATIASVSKVGEWVESVAGEVLSSRAAKVAEIESHSQIRPALSDDSTLAPRESLRQTVARPVEIPIGVASDHADGSNRRSLRLAVIGLLVAGSVVTAVLWRQAAQHAPAKVESASASATATPSITTTATTPATFATALQSTTPAIATPSAATLATSTKPAVTPPHATVRDLPSARSPVKSACSPPFTIDANGVKQYKVECL